MQFDGYEIDPNNIPKHVAIIMDGNGRWAKKRRIEKLKGHYQGLETLIDVLKGCEKLNVKILTIFAFSTENWKRPYEEVSGLMGLFEHFFKREFKNLKDRNIRVLHSGIYKGFSDKIIKIMDYMKSETETNDGFILNLAINYGGREEIVQATKNIAKKVSEGDISYENIDSKLFEEHLFHPELPDPDLLIRTSGELRVSNFLLWQIAYSELWFTDKFWPDFDQSDLFQAVCDYQKRDRRFGGHNE